MHLEDLCEGVFDCPHSTPIITKTGPYVVRSQDMRSGVFRADEAARVSEQTYAERIVRAEPRYGDILYSREGTYFGIAADVPKDIKLCLGQRMVLIRPKKDRLHPRFLRLWLNSRTLSRHIRGFRDGTVAERLNMPTIRSLPVPRFDFTEQESIVSLIGPLDDKIELNRQMSETLEESARSLFKDWFIDFGPTRAKISGASRYLSPNTWALFPDVFDDVGIPAPWSKTKLGTEFDLTMGQSPPGDTYNEAGQGLPFFQGRTDFGFRYPIRRVFCSAPTRTAEPDDTLVSVRAPVGDLNMAWERCCIGRGVAAVRHKSGSRSFTYYAIASTQQALRAYEHTGTVFGAINKQQFAMLDVISPSTMMIAAFEDSVAPFDARIRANTSENETLSQLRNMLLPGLISGQLRLKDAARQIKEGL
jgi:type I restriction enzyme S subunit